MIQNIFLSVVCLVLTLGIIVMAPKFKTAISGKKLENNINVEICIICMVSACLTLLLFLVLLIVNLMHPIL